MLGARTILVGLIAVLVIGSAVGASKRQPAHGQQPIQAPSSTQPSIPDQRGTDQMPLTIKVLPGEDAKEKADKEERERAEEAGIDKKLADETQRLANETQALSSYTGGLAIFTLFLFLAAVGQITLFVWQLRLIRETANAAKDGALAAMDSVDTAKASMITGNRAYVGVETIDLECPNLSNASYEIPDIDKLPAGFVFREFVKIVVKNYGQSPALNVVAVVNWEPVTPFGANIPRSFHWADYQTMGRTEFGSAPILDREKSYPARIPLDKLKRIRDAQAKANYLYFYGHIDYSDIFKRKWVREFCFVYAPWHPNRFVPYWEHNEEKEVTESIRPN